MVLKNGPGVNILTLSKWPASRYFAGDFGALKWFKGGLGLTGMILLPGRVTCLASECSDDEKQWRNGRLKASASFKTKE